jgi:hypothetical protein
LLGMKSYATHIRNWLTLDPINATNMTQSTSSGTQHARILWTSATDATVARLTRSQLKSLQVNEDQY